VREESQTLATITIQNYFRMYEKLSGMTGTAETEETEFHDIYKLRRGDPDQPAGAAGGQPTRVQDAPREVQRDRHEVEREHKARPARPGRTVNVEVSETLPGC